MENQSDQQRIKAMYQMLFEMATGNLTFRLHASNEHDEIRRLSDLLNVIASEMQVVLHQSGYVNPHYSYQNLVQATFILNEHFVITSFNSDVTSILNFTADELFQSEFATLIAPQSIDLWNKIKQEAADNLAYHTTLHIVFLTGRQKLLPSFCTISRLLYSDKILVSSITTILRDLLQDANRGRIPETMKQSDTVVIQRLYDYILNHLESPLPTLKELSKLFETNEYKLKYGFREMFKTSIYNFYHEERLKRAYLLIQQTSLPLKEIAIMCGFNTYLNFYKAFRKRFDCIPGDVDRGPEESQQLFTGG